MRRASTHRPTDLALDSPAREKLATKCQKDSSSPSGLNRQTPLSPGDGQYEQMLKIKLSIESCKQRIKKGDYPTEKQRLVDLDRLSTYHGQLAVMSLCDTMCTEARSTVDGAIKIKSIR